MSGMVHIVVTMLVCSSIVSICNAASFAEHALCMCCRHMQRNSVNSADLGWSVQHLCDGGVASDSAFL